MNERGTSAGGRPSNDPTPLVVTLVSSDVSEIAVPATVTIPANYRYAHADLTVVDDAVQDGTQTVTITGSAAGFTSGEDSLAVLDND